jgi:hypothetical protein
LIRTLVSKPFHSDDPTPVDVVVETFDSGAIVEYPLPTPRIALNVDKSMFLADGVDQATVTATFERCDVIDGELVWIAETPTGTVTFTVNLRPTTITVGPDGTAILQVASSTTRLFRISASLSGYGDAQATVEAV